MSQMNFNHIKYSKESMDAGEKKITLLIEKDSKTDKILSCMAKVFKADKLIENHKFSSFEKAQNWKEQYLQKTVS